MGRLDAYGVDVLATRADGLDIHSLPADDARDVRQVGNRGDDAQRHEEGVARLCVPRIQAQASVTLRIRCRMALTS